MAVRDRPPLITRPRSAPLDREPVTTERIGRSEHAKPWHPCGITGPDDPLERPGGSRLEGKCRFEVERTAGIDHRTDGWAVSTERQPQSAEVPAFGSLPRQAFALECAAQIDPTATPPSALEKFDA